MGLVVVSSGGSNYWHNYVPLAPDGTPPVIQTGNANGVTLTMTYNELLKTGSVPANGDFAISGGHSVAGVNVTGATVVLTLSPAATAGETGLTVSYTKGASPIEDLAGNDAGEPRQLRGHKLPPAEAAVDRQRCWRTATSRRAISAEVGWRLLGMRSTTIASAETGGSHLQLRGRPAPTLVSPLTDTPGNFTSMSALTIDVRARTTGPHR